MANVENMIASSSISNYWPFFTCDIVFLQDFEDDTMDDLLVKLKELATDSNKYRAKKDRRHQRSSFRDIIRTIEVSLIPWHSQCNDVKGYSVILVSLLRHKFWDVKKMSLFSKFPVDYSFVYELCTTVFIICSVDCFVEQKLSDNGFQWQVLSFYCNVQQRNSFWKFKLIF